MFSVYSSECLSVCLSLEHVLTVVCKLIIIPKHVSICYEIMCINQV